MSRFVNHQRHADAALEVETEAELALSLAQNMFEQNIITLGLVSHIGDVDLREKLCVIDLLFDTKIAQCDEECG